MGEEKQVQPNLDRFVFDSLTALVLSTWLVHHGQTNLPIFHTLGVRGAFDIATDVRIATRTEFNVSILKSGALGDARRWIRVPISSTHWHMMRRTIAWQARVRMIRDTRDAALFLRAGDVAGKATANVAFDAEPRTVLDVPVGQLA